MEVIKPGVAADEYMIKVRFQKNDLVKAQILSEKKEHLHVKIVINLEYKIFIFILGGWST